VVEDGRALVEAARKLKPDVIVADISMPHLNGLDALDALKRQDPHARVVFLTMHQDAVYARRALDAGAMGYVLKHSASAELVSAVRAVLAGKIFITPALEGEIHNINNPGTPISRNPAAALTLRQREILQLLVEGQTVKEIAGVLSISPRTVEFHKYRMIELLGLRNGADLIRFALKSAPPS
jgi:DNA-binding NarL/FixJ family response regulator